MRFLGGLLGGKGGTRNLLQDLLRGLASDGVPKEVWDRCLAADGFEDVLEEQFSNKSLAAIVAKHPGNALGLVGLCVEAIEAALGLDSSAFDDKAEVALVNSTLVLTYLLASEPQDPSPSSSTPAGAEAAAAAEQPAERPLRKRLWEPAQGEAGSRPAGERIADAAMRVLFLDGFTIDGTDAKGEGEEPAPDGLDPACLWQEGIGPEGATQGKPDNDMRSNRQLALQLLVALLCGGAPAAAPDAESGAAAGAAASSPVASSKPLISDSQPLAYLVDPERSVPLRAELLYSLVSVALSYDPHGYGVPYAGYFAGAEEEAFATMCLQVLGLLLQDAADAGNATASAVVTWRPQESRGAAGAAAGEPLPLGGSGRHAFRELLAAIDSEREMEFLVGGVAALLGTMSEERSTYLPSSMRLPTFLPELLTFAFHLAACGNFVRALSTQGEVAALVEGVLHVAAQAPEHVDQDLAGLLTGAVLVRLTGYREVCAALNDDFEGDAPDDLPEFEGSLCDLLALASLKQAADHFSTGSSNEVHRTLIEVHLSVLGNVSTFAEGLAMETCLRLFALLERCAKAAQLKFDKAGISAWLPRLLEVCMNVIHYQYGLNGNLVYGLMTRRTLFADLGKRVAFLRAQAEAVGAEVAQAGAKAHAAKTEQADVGEQARQGSTAASVAEWWREAEKFLEPLLGLLDAVVPQIEAEVEKRDISSPDEAKELLPRCVLGLLPVPHAFAMRTLRYSKATHRACEECLVACLRVGPLAALWDTEGDGGAAGASAAQPAKGADAPAAAERRPSGARERSASRRRPSTSGRASSVTGRSSSVTGRSSSVTGRERSASRGPRGGARPPPADSVGRPAPGAARPPAADGGAGLPAAGGAAEGAAGAGNNALMAQLEAAAAQGVDLVALAKQLQAQQQAAAEGGGAASQVAAA